MKSEDALGSVLLISIIIGDDCEGAWGLTNSHLMQMSDLNT